MKIIVQKFGGTSLQDAEIRQHAVEHIKKARQQGYQVVVVVSAMGRKGAPYATETLMNLVQEEGKIGSDREYDLLLACGEMISSVIMASKLNAQDIPAVSFTGKDAGILTNDDFGNAHIISIQPQAILEQLKLNKVVVVCGFQGATRNGDITTLGRGASDTSATALGAALKAEVVDIFTDVSGIMTADPRIVEDASRLNWLTYNEICNLAYQGAKVIHPRAVEIAMQHQVPIRVRSTLSDDEGTLVTSVRQIEQLEGKMNERLITGIAQVPQISQIKVYAKEGDYDLQLKVFKAMAENRISVDFINVNPTGVVYTVFEHVTDKAISILNQLGYEPVVERRCAKVSTVGAGMAGVPGVMAQIVEALTNEDVQILQSADSHTTIWVLVKEEDMVRAVQALHSKFELHKVNEIIHSNYTDYTQLER